MGHGAYAYNLNINESMNLSMGLNIGILQYKIDFTKIEMEYDDPVMYEKENYYLPEQGLGRVLLFRPVRWDYFYDEVEDYAKCFDLFKDAQKDGLFFIQRLIL